MEYQVHLPSPRCPGVCGFRNAWLCHDDCSTGSTDIDIIDITDIDITDIDIIDIADIDIADIDITGAEIQ
jgi:hypothetical protein